MKTVCLYFQVHQPLRLKTYRFFNMGKDHNYLDVSANRSIMQRVAAECYLPMNNLLLRLIRENEGAFKVTFSISGLAIEQFRSYTPEVLESFRALAQTGCVEFLAETYSHSLSSLISPEEFKREVEDHVELMKNEFGYTPTSFRNTELIYSDQIGEQVAAMGFKAMLAEGARHVLGWKSPNFVYANSLDSKLRVLLRNYKLSDDIAFRFSNQGWGEYPLTAEKYAGWIADENTTGEVINLFMDYETFGEHQKASSGIFDFMAALPKAMLATGNLKFGTVTETAAANQPTGVLYCTHAMSWADEERDVTAWLGNELQNEAFGKLYMIIGMVSDKDFDAVIPLMPRNAYYIFTAASVARSLPAEELAAKFRAEGFEGEVAPNVHTAYRRAIELADPDEDFVFVGGSTFVVADLLSE